MAKPQNSGRKKTTAVGVAVAILIALYSLVRPSINDATGWSMPAIGQISSVAKTWPANHSPAQPSLKYGALREVGDERYLSPAGLLYTPGSAEGHRLEHLRRHTADQPDRPGKHGVFDGGMEGALKTIDQAYENAKIGKRTTKHTEDGRTIYTVDMGQGIGFVGGREGNRRNKPMARRVQIVLDGNRVITAYPL